MDTAQRDGLGHARQGAAYSRAASGHTGARFTAHAAGAGTAILCGKPTAALPKPIHRIDLSIRSGCPRSTAAACFGSARDHAEAPDGHGWQQTGPTCPATNTSAHPTSGAAARHPREAEVKCRAEGTPPTWYFYSYKRFRADQRSKSTTENVRIENRDKACTKSSDAGCTAKDA